MKILVATNHLQCTGGTETYTYALALELKRCGHEVEYFTFVPGEVSDLLEKAGVRFMTRKKYDLILANHVPVVEHLQPLGCVIQTCHGTVPDLEQPSASADLHVSVTEEIRCHLLAKGIKSSVIHNGIDCNRFAPMSPLNEKLTTVLSLCQSDAANEFIADCCAEIGVNFISCNKFTDNVWELENVINQADLVVGIGRSLYDSMACGRYVVSYDNRGYMDKALGDGYLTSANFDESLLCNCSGRSSRRNFTKEEFIAELLKYDPEDGLWTRNTALERLNVREAAEKYIALYKSCRVKIYLKRLFRS